MNSGIKSCFRNCSSEGSTEDSKQVFRAGHKFNDIAEAIELVTSRKDVAIFEGFVSFAALDSVDLVSVEEAIKLDFAFALQNNSEFLGMFNYHIGKMKSSGVHTKLSQKWLRCKFMEKGKTGQ